MFAAPHCFYKRKVLGSMKKLTKEEWLRRKRQKMYIRRVTAIMILVLFVLILIFAVKGVIMLFRSTDKKDDLLVLENGTKIQQDFLTPNPYSRPQDPLEKVNGIVIHYVGNSGISAQSNKNYFESLKDSKSAYASSHFLVGIEGEVIQCLPLNEIAFASKERNLDTISIEFSHKSIDGEPSENTYESLVELSVALCKKYNLTSKDILRHYDVTGKICPRYYVDNEDAWNAFLEEVDARLNNSNQS